MAILQVQTLVNLVMVEYSGNTPDVIAGFGLCFMTVNVMYVSVTYGLNGALDTLISQSYGRNQLDMCSVYLHRSRLIVLIYFIIIAIPMANIGTILKAIGQDPASSDFA